MMKTIVISGVTGFLGKNLTTYLQHKYKIEGVYRKNKNSQFTYDSLSSVNIDNTSAFIHLAGKAHDLKNTSKQEEYFDVNTELTIRLFELFLESNCTKFIFTSSVKAVADTVQEILTEDTPAQPLTFYGKSKLEAENYILSKKLPKSKSVYILRPCMIHGPSNKGNLNLLYKFISMGIPYPLGKYQNKRSFVSVENICFIIEQLLEKDVKSGIYNVADDDPLSTKELVELIAQVISKPAKILNLPKGLVKLMAQLGNMVNLPFNSHRLEKLTENYEVSNVKIKTELGTELPISTKEGLRKTIKSFK